MWDACRHADISDEFVHQSAEIANLRGAYVVWLTDENKYDFAIDQELTDTAAYVPPADASCLLPTVTRHFCETMTDSTGITKANM